MAVITNKYIAIKTHINGSPRESDFKFKTKPGSNDVIVKTLYLSIDPSQINRMKTSSSLQKAAAFAAAIIPGEAVDAIGVGKVVASGHPDFKKDDLVSGMISWGEYSIVKGGKMLNVVDLMGLPLSYHVGILGFSGLTAYAGFFQVGKPKKGEKGFVSTASGSVRNLVGQYAKLFGRYVVGCAGTHQKVCPKYMSRAEEPDGDISRATERGKKIKILSLLSSLFSPFPRIIDAIINYHCLHLTDHHYIFGEERGATTMRLSDVRDATMVRQKSW